MLLESSDGRYMPGRCKSVNQCDYCAKLAAVENAELLAQDALVNSAPAVWSVSTTRSTVAAMEAYSTARKGVKRAVRRRWPDAECATLVEFQSGAGTNSGGRRRPHWNDLWKGIPVGDLDELHEILSSAWCKRVDALPEGQFVGAVAEVGGLMRYLALHFQKESQQPPEGWRSHRFATTRGYLSEPADQARDRARDALRLRREIWKLDQAHGDELDAELINECAQVAHERNQATTWRVVRRARIPVAFDENGIPAVWDEITFPV